MSDKNKTGRGFGGKGYYIALILCAAAIGISGYLYYRNANQQDKKLQNVTATVPVGNRDDVSAIATRPNQPDGSTEASDPTTPTRDKPLKTASPVSGELVADFAMDCLSYNATTRDWRVHDGIDIAADAGTQVLAAADGVVYTTYEDDAMGATVVIRHEGGYTTKYSSLDPALSVSAGDTVSLGDPIGCVGSSALLESALGDHVHFSVTCDDEPVNPTEFLNLG